MRLLCSLVLAAVGCVVPAKAVRQEEAFNYLHDRCDRGDTAACLRAIDERTKLDTGDETNFVPKPFVLRSMARRACELGEPDGCWWAAMIAGAYKLPAAEGENAQLLLRSCREGSLTGCFWVLLANDEVIVEPDLALVLRHELRACDRGSMVSCSGAGIMLVTGTGGRADEALGIKLLTRACEGSADQCDRLAALVNDGKLVHPDARRLAALCKRYRSATLHSLERGELADRDPTCPDPWFETVKTTLAPLRKNPTSPVRDTAPEAASCPVSP